MIAVVWALSGTWVLVLWFLVFLLLLFTFFGLIAFAVILVLKPIMDIIKRRPYLNKKI